MTSLMGELPILLVRATILVLPTLLIGAVSLRRQQMGDNCLLLWLGTAFEACVCFLSFFSRGTWRQPLGPSLITLYLIGLAWLWFGDKHEDWLSQLSKSFLLIVPLIVFGFQTLYESGAPAIRRANLLAKRIRDRKDWPSELTACRTMPEVKALRAALGIDASPARPSAPPPSTLSATSTSEASWKRWPSSCSTPASRSARPPSRRFCGIASTAGTGSATPFAG
jgi:hypothetical protein